jgi:hypothetical protein
MLYFITYIMKTHKNSSKKLLVGICAGCLISFLLTSCLKTDNAPYNPPTGLLSFIQASPDEPPLDFFLNNNRVNQGALYFGDNIDYVSAIAGPRIVNFYATGTTTPILSAPITLNQSTAYSLFLVNKASSPQVLLLTDTLTKPATGNATVRFVDLSPDAPAVDLAVQGGAVLVPNKSYEGYSSFVPVVAKSSYTFEVRQAGTSTVLATLSNVPLVAGSVYTIWFGGLATPTSNNDKLSANIVTNAYYIN